MTVFPPISWERLNGVMEAARRSGLGPLAFTEPELRAYIAPGLSPTTLLGDPVVLLPNWPRWFVTACRQIDGDLS